MADNQIINIDSQDEQEIVVVNGILGVQGIQGDPGPEGKKGDTGDTISLKVGTVTTTEPGVDAAVTSVFNEEEKTLTLNFSIPKGETYSIQDSDKENITNALAQGLTAEKIASAFDWSVLYRTYQGSVNDNIAWQKVMPLVKPGYILQTKIIISAKDEEGKPLNTSIKEFIIETAYGADGGGAVSTVNERLPLEGKVVIYGSDIKVTEGSEDTIDVILSNIQSTLSTALQKVASKATLGGVIIGDSLSIDDNGILSCQIASADTCGVVKIGTNSGLTIDEKGYLSVSKTAAQDLANVQIDDKANTIMTMSY